jgi:uncharacterized protein involved in exopolysaccharide biosynthesis
MRAIAPLVERMTSPGENEKPDVSASGELESEIDSRLAVVRAPKGAMLVVVDGEEPGRAYVLGRLDRTLGRSPAADIQVDEAAVSQLHARIFVQAGRYRIEDLDSTNGTYVNGERIRQDVVLRPGDVLSLGETQLQYMEARGDEAPPPTLVLRGEHPRNIQGTRPEYAGRPAFASRVGAPRELEEPGFREIVLKTIAGIRFLRRHRWVLMAFACVGVLLGGLTVMVKPPLATASVQLRLKKVQTPNPVQPHERRVVDVSENINEDYFNPELASSVLEGLSGTPPTRAQLVQTLKFLKLENTVAQSYRGTFVDASPERAKAFLSAHLSAFIDRQIGEMVKVAQAEVEFLREQLEHNASELQTTETLLRDFKQKHLDGLPEQAQEELGSLVTLRTRESDLISLIDRTALELELARKRASSDESTFESRVESTKLYRDSIIEAQRNLTDARARGLGEAHPEVVKLKREVEELKRLDKESLNQEVSEQERRLDRERRTRRDDVAVLEVRHKAAQKELGQIRGRIAKSERVVRELPDVEARYAELTRTYSSHQDLHARLFQQLKAAEVKLEFERASAAARYDITRPPEAFPASYRRTAATRAGIGGVLGLCLALGLAGLIELRRYVSQVIG